MKISSVVVLGAGSAGLMAALTLKRKLPQLAVHVVRSKDIALGGFYRRMAARRGGLVANIALARKLALLFWRVMVKGLDYVEEGLARYEAKVLETKQRALRRLAKELGQQLVPVAQRARSATVHGKKLPLSPETPHGP